MKRSNKILAIMVACAVVALGFGFFVMRNRTSPLPTQQTNTPTDDKTNQDTVVKDVPKPDDDLVSTTDWKVYTNDKHGFNVSYPPYLKAGSVSDNSVLGTFAVPVRGLHVGPLLLVVLKDADIKKTAEELFKGVYDAAKNPKPVVGAEVMPVECKLETDTARIKAVSCNGEGGAALYAYITGPVYDVFVDGYSKGYDNQDNGNLKAGDFKTILSTFKFASEVSASSVNPVTPLTAATSTPATTPSTTPSIQMFTINADDSIATPSEITVKKDAIVQITFVVGTNTYYGGLDFKSSVVNSGTVNAGQSKTISFKAKESFQFTPYWPASSVAKAYKISVTVI